MTTVGSPGRRRIDEIGDESRRRILDAAEELFAERGFDRTSFIDISERSGISRGSIPWHFKNKDGLMVAVVERAMDRFRESVRFDDALPELAEVFQDYAKWVRGGQPTLLFMMLTEALGSAGGVRAQYQEFFARSRKGLELWLRVQRPEGVDPAFAAKQERDFASAVHGAILGIHLGALIDPDGVDLDGSLRAMACLLGRNVADVWREQPAPAKVRAGAANKRNGTGSRKRRS
ncbi:TetR family transcriptional regulator [Amycolatopsis sulphurea]|uniref:TetR family transcriptional regulator n=1 Tax=Amycolatopsis sulphurea TaxID=76022 RepID=A0A2A9FBC6_9PSEU|nr:TetR/AcrR family transcriptional regulator [Amycolatopsis sulphurea]PFG48727.1 TetR family transcriptional regulator [Amycolatopsis sulphurea]